MHNKSLGKGFLFAIIAYFLWGIFPLFWKLLIEVNSIHILAFRIIFSFIFVALILLLQKNSAWLTVFKDPKKAGIIILTGIIISCNWGLYIWAVNSGHTLEASLGYYINPLVSILLGMIFFRERLTPLQWVAVGVAFAGVLLLTILSGTLPWISLALALTFGFYALLKKKHSLSALESLGAETLVSVPIGLTLLLFTFGSGAVIFTGMESLNYFSDLPVKTWLLLPLCGIISATPLYFFGKGAKLLPLSALGFCQFISPTLQFICGLFIFGEDFPPHYFAAFGLIWTAVIIYIISLNIKK